MRIIEKHTVAKVAYTMALCSLLVSCTNEETNTAKSDSITSGIKSQNVQLDEAKQLSKSIIDYVEQADMNEITIKTLSRKADPLQLKLDSVRKKLNPAQVKELDAYRNQLLDEMAARRLARQNKS